MPSRSLTCAYYAAAVLSINVAEQVMAIAIGVTVGQGTRSPILLVVEPAVALARYNPSLQLS